MLRATGLPTRPRRAARSANTKIATITNSQAASCNAAPRSPSANQVRKMPVVNVATPKYSTTP